MIDDLKTFWRMQFWQQSLTVLFIVLVAIAFQWQLSTTWKNTIDHISEGTHGNATDAAGTGHTDDR